MMADLLDHSSVNGWSIPDAGPSSYHIDEPRTSPSASMSTAAAKSTMSASQGGNRLKRLSLVSPLPNRASVDSLSPPLSAPLRTEAASTPHSVSASTSTLTMASASTSSSIRAESPRVSSLRSGAGTASPGRHVRRQSSISYSPSSSRTHRPAPSTTAVQSGNGVVVGGGLDTPGLGLGLGLGELDISNGRAGDPAERALKQARRQSLVTVGYGAGSVKAVGEYGRVDGTSALGDAAGGEGGGRGHGGRLGKGITLTDQYVHHMPIPASLSFARGGTYKSSAAQAETGAAKSSSATEYDDEV